jgi:hypothetical protein
MQHNAFSQGQRRGHSGHIRLYDALRPHRRCFRGPQDAWLFRVQSRVLHARQEPLLHREEFVWALGLLMLSVIGYYTQFHM